MTADDEARVRFWLGDDFAYALWHSLGRAFHLWDDLIDRDKEIPLATVNAVMFDLMVGIPANPFYQRYQSQILPVLTTIIASWAHVIPALERGDSKSRLSAHRLRGRAVSDLNFLLLLVMLTRGQDFLATIAEEIAEMAARLDKPLEDYLAELDRHGTAPGTKEC